MRRSSAVRERVVEGSAERDGPLRILLVEDDRVDARRIKESFRGSGSSSERAAARGREAPDGRSADAARLGATIVHETRLSDGLDRLDEGHADVVLLDLDLPDSDGLATVETVRRHADSVPVVALTGVRDRELGKDALRSGADEHLFKDEIDSGLLVRSVYHTIERKEHELELERRRGRLAALDSLNELVHEISDVAIESSTREGIERSVCELIADSDLYSFAWFGEVDHGNGTVTKRTGIDADAHPDGGTVRIDDGEWEPARIAVRTGEIHVARNVPERPENDSRREHSLGCGFRSAAAIPIEYEETLYGVLNVHSKRRDAFDDEERTVIGRLGEVIGHAVNAIERQRALMGEDVVEIRIRIEDVLDAFDVPSTTDGTITFDRTIRVSDDAFLEYGTVTADARETLRALVEHFDHFESMTMLNGDDGAGRFELRLARPPVVSTIASNGGRVESAVVSDGDYDMVVHVPAGTDASPVIEAVRTHYPDAAVIAQRHTVRTERSATRLESFFAEELTEKQRVALESAYFAGFFEWPRDSSGEDVAESIGISPSTFHQHVRAAERKLLRALFDTEG